MSSLLSEQTRINRRAYINKYKHSFELVPEKEGLAMLLHDGVHVSTFEEEEEA